MTQPFEKVFGGVARTLAERGLARREHVQLHFESLGHARDKPVCLDRDWKPFVSRNGWRFGDCSDHGIRADDPVLS